MNYLIKLKLLVTQFVFCSATLTNSMISQFNINMNLHNNIILRSSTVRDNISYHIQLFKSKQEDDRFLELLQICYDFISKFDNSNDRIIIYVMSSKLAQELDEFLSSPYYFGRMSIEDKNKNINLFISSERIIITTSALGEGFDYSSIRVIIHYLSVFSIIDFQQQTGRAGRDLKNSISLILTTSYEMKINDNDDEYKRLFKEYLLKSICRRRVIDRVFDNNVIDSCLSSQSLCDLCLKRSDEQLIEINSFKSIVRENVQSNSYSFGTQSGYRAYFIS